MGVDAKGLRIRRKDKEEVLEVDNVVICAGQVLTERARCQGVVCCSRLLAISN